GRLGVAHVLCGSAGQMGERANGGDAQRATRQSEAEEHRVVYAGKYRGIGVNMTTVKEIEAELKDYLIACYGDPHKLSTQQLKEVRQAFLSGIHWRDCEPTLEPGDCEDAIRSLLG